MLAIRNFDEVNNYVKNKRSVDLQEYFGDMDLPDISYQIIESVQNNPDDPFYVAPDRAKYLAENEANTSLNHQDFVDAIAAGKTRKKWVDIRDDRERPDHRKVGGTIKPITEPFLVGDSIMDYPKDTSYGASANQIVNCRCTIKYI